MKKSSLLVALLALAGTAVSTYADVQNIRISGDIRVRGYYTVNNDGGNSLDDSYISQRTRVSVEADLEDHVLVVVTVKAEDLWGKAGTSPSNSGNILNTSASVGVTEAYVQFSEMFYSPATLTLGRQHLHYGRGLLISGVEDEINYDAARLVLDYYPTTVDLVYAALWESTPFGANTGLQDLHLLWANARHELSDSVISNIEGYFGYLLASQGANSLVGAQFPSAAVIGARADLNLSENLSAWVEGAYEFGPDGFISGGPSLEAFIGQAGIEFALPDVEMSPVINAQYTYASGGGTTGQNRFFWPLGYQEGYNGYLFSPQLSNIQILNLGVTLSPAENTTLALQGYYYLQADSGTAINPLVGSVYDNGTLGVAGPNGTSKDLGWEFDTILGYDYSKDVSLQLVYAVFIPENGYTSGPSDSLVHEVRGEVSVQF